MCGLLGFASGELGPAVISRIDTKPGDYYENTYPGSDSLLFNVHGVAALSLAYPASVQAVPTTYHYRGNPFTDVSGPYTTSDFVRAMTTLASPLGAKFNGSVSPTAFTFSNGVQTISYLNAVHTSFNFSTDATGAIISWYVTAERRNGAIATDRQLRGFPNIFDYGYVYRPFAMGRNDDAKGGVEGVRIGLHPRQGAGRGVYPIIDDADPYGVGSSGPEVQACSGLTALGLGEVVSCRFGTRPASKFQKRSQLSRSPKSNGFLS